MNYAIFKIFSTHENFNVDNLIVKYIVKILFHCDIICRCWT